MRYVYFDWHGSTISQNYNSQKIIHTPVLYEKTIVVSLLLITTFLPSTTGNEKKCVINGTIKFASRKKIIIVDYMNVCTTFTVSSIYT